MGVLPPMKGCLGGGGGPRELPIRSPKGLARSPTGSQISGGSYGRGEFTKTNISSKACIQCICWTSKEIFSQNHVFSLFVGLKTNILNPGNHVISVYVDLQNI